MPQKAQRKAAKQTLTIAFLRTKILKVTRAYGVTNVLVFGSFARGDQGKKSDLDLLVDFPEGMSLLDVSGLKIDLEEAVQRKVDLVSTRSVKAALRERIYAEARPL